ncbi:MAG: anti-sigma factor [Lysobacterales bacterium]|jgi:hypothetical protein
MDIDRIIDALKQAADEEPKPNGACLDPGQLAAFMDGGLSFEERAAAERHLAGCDHCLAQLAAMLRSAGGTDVPSLPAEVVEQAERLATPSQRRRRTHFGWAAAAVLVLAVSIVSIQWVGGPTAPEQEPTRETRYIDRQPLQPTLLAPREGSVIQPLEQVFRWTSVPGSLFYDVQLVNADGDLLLRERVDDTRWLIPKDLKLTPGAEYYVRIDAYVSDAKYLSSEHVAFSVGGGD